MSRDPHRPEARCETCRFFEWYQGGGVCSYNPPTMVSVDGSYGVPHWTVTQADFWCSKWQHRHALILSAEAEMRSLIAEREAAIESQRKNKIPPQFWPEPLIGTWSLETCGQRSSPGEGEPK